MSLEGVSDRWLPAKLFLRENRFFFKNYYRFKESSYLNTRIVRPGVEAVIEGYPRSGNSFALYAFLEAQGRKMLVANHFHSSAQFLLASRDSIPAMLALRDPVDAATSFIIFGGAANAKDALMRYIAFHRPLISIKNSFSVAPFEEITSDFGRSIDRLNRHFGTHFNRFVHDETSNRRILDQLAADKARRARERRGLFADMLRASFPNAEKERRKAAVLRTFSDMGVQDLLRESNRLYDELIVMADS